MLRVYGDSMEGAGIYDQDEIIVDRTIKPRTGKVVDVSLDGEFTVKRLGVDREGKGWLLRVLSSVMNCWWLRLVGQWFNRFGFENMCDDLFSFFAAWWGRCLVGGCYPLMNKPHSTPLQGFKS